MGSHRLTLDRKTCIGIAVVALLVGGLRFSDGSVLLAMASGQGIDAPAFASRSAQYVWDSPLKVSLLKLCPPRIVWIGLVFALLATLPLLGLFARQGSKWFALTAVAVGLSPAVRVSFQNVGLGDGLVMLLIVVAVASSSRALVFAALLGIGLWHPQQSFFIGGTYLIYTWVYEAGPKRERLISAALGLAAAALGFLIYKKVLGFEYHGRSDYMLAEFPALPLRNLRSFPVWGFYVVFWLYLTRRLVPQVRLSAYVLGWSLVLLGVGFIVKDVSRVVSIIALPALLIPLKRYHADAADRREGEGEGEEGDDREEPGAEAAAALEVPWAWVLVAAVLVPVYSWSGYDVFLWPDLLHDLRKWGVF